MNKLTMFITMITIFAISIALFGKDINANSLKSEVVKFVIKSSLFSAILYDLLFMHNEIVAFFQNGTFDLDLFIAKQSTLFPASFILATLMTVCFVYKFGMLKKQKDKLKDK